jgi:hypothetical protein
MNFNQISRMCIHGARTAQRIFGLTNAMLVSASQTGSALAAVHCAHKVSVHSSAEPRHSRRRDTWIFHLGA